MGWTTRVIALITGAHAAIGFWLAESTPGPLLSADDVAYLGLARTIAGNGDVPLPIQPPYGLLYPLLLAPGWVVGLGESAMITFGRLLNASLGAALIPLLYLLLRRITRAAPRQALLGAVVGSSLPAALGHTSIIWTENLLPVVVVAGLLVLDWLRSRPSTARAILLVAVAVAQVATHPRAILSALVLVAVGVWVTARDRQPVVAGLMAAATAALLGLNELVRSAVQDAAFGSPGLYDTGDLADRRGLGEVPEMLVLGAGTLAYLLIASAGLAAIGGVALWRAGPVGRAAVLMVAATVAMAGWFLTGVPRADKWLHGRYIESVAAPLVAIGVIRLSRLGSRWLSGLVGALVAAGVFAAWAGPGDNWARARSPVMMLGVEPGGAPFGTPRFEPGAATSIAIVFLVIGWFLAARWQVAYAAFLAVIVAVAAASVYESLDDLYAASAAADADEAVSDDVEHVVIDPAVGTGAWSATAWRVGLDHVTVGRIAGPFPSATHVLLPDTADAPDGAGPAATVADAALYPVR